MTELDIEVGSLLSQKSGDVWSIAPDATVYRAVEIMAEKEIGALLVMEHDKLCGIVSERDYARKIILKGKSSKDTLVSEIMSSPVITVSPRHTIEACMRIITENRVRHLPVVQEEKVIAVVSIGDLVNWAILEQRKTIRHLEAYISGQAS